MVSVSDTPSIFTGTGTSFHHRGPGRGFFIEQYSFPLIHVLCGRHDSVYKDIPGCSVWDKERNAWNFKGPGPVIAHPPCRLWGRLSQCVRVSDGEAAAEIALGIFAARCVQRWGGVLEHPAGSGLWTAAGLPSPGEIGVGFTIAVPQFWFGHSCRKSTWLYFVGLSPRDLPTMPLRLEGPEIQKVEKLSGGRWKRAREATPVDLAHWLVLCAEKISARRARNEPGLIGRETPLGTGHPAEVISVREKRKEVR